ncbi:hypothetical protein SDC9_103913 [bioreactor metagenome]|uniref:Uncharacterized protein n=1 Tax=bioreactor metagenome TaxID=1076179 RepID=A0A645AV10_9ZZZZ
MKDLVHFGHIVLIQKIVGVENKVTLVLPVGIGILDEVENIIEGIALAHRVPVMPLADNRARLTGYLGGAVGAVISHDKHIQQLGGIVLVFYALYQLGNDGLFVARGNHRGVAVRRRGVLLLLAAARGNAHQSVNQLIKIHGGQDEKHH